MTAYEREMKRIAEKMKNKGYVADEQRDVETQLEAIANGDAEMTDELRTRAEDLGIDVSAYERAPTSQPTTAPTTTQNPVTKPSAPSTLPSQPTASTPSTTEKTPTDFAIDTSYAANETTPTITPAPTVTEKKLADDVTYAGNESNDFKADPTPTITAAPTSKPTVSDDNMTYAGNEGETKPVTTPSTEQTGSIPSYQEYVDSVNREKAAASNAIYTAQTAYWDERTKEALAALDRQKASAESYAANERDTTKKAAEALKDSSYESAAAQKEITYAEAEKDRERASVDASSAYAENRAGYGTNAERMANMGMTASGYSDYEDSKAYAQQRAEIQGANAKAQQEMRYADYEERESQRAADTDYAKAINDADLSYARNMYDISSSYEKDKMAAGQAGSEGKLSAALTYMQSLGNDAVSKEAKKETLMQMASNGEASAELVAMLGKQYGMSEEEIAQIAGLATKYSDQAAADQKTQNISALTQMAASGEANSELLTTLGKLYGLTDDEIANITGIANNKQTEAETKAEEEKSAAIREQINSLGNDYTASDVDYLDIPDEQKQELKQAAYDKVIEQAKASIAQNGGQLGTLDDVDALYQSREIDEATYREIYRENLNALTAGAKTAEDIESVEQQLQNYASKGLITTAERQEATKQLYASAVQSVDGADKVTFNGLMTATVKFGTSSYNVKIAGAAGKNIQSLLNKVTPSAKDGDMARFDGQIYVKRNDKWRVVTDAYGDGFYQAYERFYGDIGNRETTTGGNNLTGGGVSNKTNVATK